MAYTELELSYKIILTHRELRLVMLGLCGKLHSGELQKEALALNELLAKQRENKFKEMVKVVEGAAIAAENLSEGEVKA